MLTATQFTEAKVVEPRRSSDYVTAQPIKIGPALQTLRQWGIECTL